MSGTLTNYSSLVARFFGQKWEHEAQHFEWAHGSGARLTLIIGLDGREKRDGKGRRSFHLGDGGNGGGSDTVQFGEVYERDPRRVRRKS
jgi:hypothetical protein